MVKPRGHNESHGLMVWPREHSETHGLTVIFLICPHPPPPPLESLSWSHGQITTPNPLDSCFLFLALFLKDSDKTLEDIIMRSFLFFLLFLPNPPLDSCVMFLVLFLRDFDKILKDIIMISLLFSLLFLPHPSPQWFLCLVSCIVLERFWQDSWRYYHKKLIIFSSLASTPPPLFLCLLSCIVL